MSEIHSDALVVFGATGDLAYKKIFPTLQAIVKGGRLAVPVIGVAREQWDDDALRSRARESIEKYGGGVDRQAFDKLGGLMRYVGGDYTDPAIFRQLRNTLGDAERPLHYLAIPPSLFPAVAQGLGNSGCSKGARVVVEKPFGHDLASAQSLNHTLHSVFEEGSIFRIDHYLGKETVQNVFYFRFINSMFEPIWNRNYIESVQVTMAESFGITGRGRFYEETGAIRDVVQNHLLQVIAVLAMEPPVGPDNEALRDEKARVLKSIRPPGVESLVRGQYRGYHDEEGVAKGSKVETSAALRLFLDSWRWQDVPFYIRTGKCFPVTVTEVLVWLHRPPQLIFSGREFKRPDTPNYFRFRLGPDVEIAIGIRAKAGGSPVESELVELYACKDRHELMEPYDRLLGDAMEGDTMLFSRQDEVEAAWRIVDPLLRDPPPVHEYEPGTWGPAEADELVTSPRGWHNPKVT